MQGHPVHQPAVKTLSQGVSYSLVALGVLLPPGLLQYDDASRQRPQEHVRLQRLSLWFRGGRVKVNDLTLPKIFFVRRLNAMFARLSF